MMNSLIITIAVLALATLLMVSFFRKKNRELRLDFSEKMNQWEGEFELHETQLVKRSSGLDRYDFLKYNLGEALVVQPEIKI